MERLLAKYTNSYLSYVILFFFYDLAFALFSALISVYLIGKGYSASQVSLLISAASLANMVTQPIIGNLTERFGMRPVNMVLFGASCFAVSCFGASCFGASCFGGSWFPEPQAARPRIISTADNMHNVFLIMIVPFCP